MRSRYWCVMVKPSLSYLLPLTPAEPLVLLNWLIVLLSMQCNCFLLKCWFDDRGLHCRCNACNHVFVDISKWLWFNIISLPMCPVLILLPVYPCGKLLFTKKKKTAHIFHPVVYVVCWCLFRERFLKKEFEADPLSWFKREILYLFCTCIINQDVFNYFGCWNKACEVVYSVAEFSLSCFATVVKLKSGVRICKILNTHQSCISHFRK